MLTAICRGKDEQDYWFYDGRISDVMSDVVYVVDEDVCIIHDPMEDGCRKDYLRETEMYLDDNELYVVLYDGDDNYRSKNHECNVDMGVTKQEIIENVLSNTYIYGASYCTFGQMLKTTHDWLDE